LSPKSKEKHKNDQHATAMRMLCTHSRWGSRGRERKYPKEQEELTKKTTPISESTGERKEKKEEQLRQRKLQKSNN
jgi:hypothetical protein